MFIFLNILPQSFHQSLVCSSWICFSTNFPLKIFDCMSHTQTFTFFIEVIAAAISLTPSSLSMSNGSFKCFTSSCCSSTFKLGSLFTSKAFQNSLLYCGLLIFVFCSLSIFPYFLSPFSWLVLLFQQQSSLCCFQPHLFRLIYMLHTCDCLLPFYF